MKNEMAPLTNFFCRLFGPKKKKNTRKDSVTGRNKTFSVPYLSRLEGNQLQPGQSLIVRGVVKGNEGFLVNLTAGPCVEIESETDQLDNRLLCLRVNILKKKVYLNACINGEWGKEHALRHEWRVGDEFDIRVRCSEELFTIFIEHKLVAKFAHYIPMSNISHIYVNGDIELYTVSWEGKYYQVPYNADIPGNFYTGRKLFLSGVVWKAAKQFNIDFVAGNDVALRIQPSFAEKKLLRSSRINDIWSTAESTIEGKFPFKRKDTFDLLVYCDDQRLVILINDVYCCSFDHKLPAHTINRLEIEGDVELLGVHIK